MPLKRFNWSSRPRFYRAQAILIILFAAIGSPLLAKRTDDVLVLKNGDKITGEINKLSNGVLYFKAGYMADSVQIDWAEVQRLNSRDEYHIFLTTGERLTGKVEAAPTAVLGGSDFIIVEAGKVRRVRQPDVVELVPVENTFWNQLTGSVDYGFAFTGGTDASQSSFSGTVAYRATKSFTQLSVSSIVDTQSGAKTSGRNTLDFQYIKYLQARWFAGELIDILNSQQQDLIFRGSLGSGIGRDLIRRTRTSFWVLGGVAYSHERYSAVLGREPQDNNAEGVLRFNFETRTFKTAQFDAQATILPSINTRGRVRFAVESSARFELVRNFYWKFSVYENYDTNPPVAAPKNDFGTTTALGWKF